MIPADVAPPDVAQAIANARVRTAGIEGWTLERWFEAITRMRCLSAKYDLGLHQHHLNTLDLPSGGGGQIGYDTVRIAKPRPALEVGSEYSGPYVVYPGEAGGPDDYVPLHYAGELIPYEALPMLLVDLSASDEHILAEVKRVLFERKNSQTIPRTPGNHSFSRSLRSGHAFKRWRDHHVIEFVELLSWRARRGAKYPKHALGFWISRKMDTSRKTSEALSIARQAIGALPEILAEVEKTRL